MEITEGTLSPLDATFLELEQANEGATMHIGGALIFDAGADQGGTPSLEELLQLLDERFAALPRFRCRLSDPRVHGLRRPEWVADPRFDLRAHVRRATLPAPGGDAEVNEWLGDFWSHRLDRMRPLWEMALVDGLEGGGWMLATKTHHAMVDGVGSIDVSHVLLDPELDPAPRAIPHRDVASHADRGQPRLPGWLSPALDVARATVDTARHPRRIVRAGEAAMAMADVLWEDEVLAARPSTLNVPIGATRSFTSAAFELAEIKRIKNDLGGTVNDVVLALATGALRRLLEHRGDPLDRPLRAMVPVNLRGADHTSLGNQVTSLFVELPVGESDRRRRYERTRAAASALKSGTAALGGSTIVLVAGAVPPLLHESISRMLFAPRLFNLTITNVPGPQVPLYALGAPLRRIVPLVPLFAGHTVGLAIVSYNGELVFGINADRATTPDLDVFDTALREEFSALLSLSASSAEAR